MTYRELRLWHWRQAILNREREEFFIASSNPAPYKMHQDLANFHIKAVQTLNDLFEIGDYAENDLAKENNVRN